MHNTGTRQRGFTLLELSIVLTIIAVILGGGLAIWIGALQANQVNATVDRMNRIEQALLGYTVANGRIPCPSDLTLTPTTATTGTYYNTTAGADYGLEAGSDAKSAIGTGTGVCSGTNMTPQANFTSASGAAEGGVPTRALRLPDDYMYDAWGHRFRYAVDPTYTKTSSPLPVKATCNLTPTPNTSAITVNDASGITGARTTTAAYVLLSHGANGHGAYTSNGVVASSGSTSADELTNCHCTSAGVYTGTYTPTYVEKVPQYDSGQAGNPLYYFDDLVTFKDAWQMQAQDFPLTTASCNTSKYVYVTDQTNCTLQKFDTSGNFIWKTGSCGGSNGFCSGGASGIAQDSSGNLWVADSVCDRVIEFNSSGSYLSKFSTDNGGYGFGPVTLTFDSGGNIWVGTTGSGGVIQKYNSSGSFLATIIHNGQGSGNGQFGNPSLADMAFDSSGNLWTLDTGNLRVEKFNSSGSYLSQFPCASGGCSNSSTSGYFSEWPWGMALDAGGNFWVADNANNRIEKFNSSGSYLSQFPCSSGACSGGGGDGQLNGPDVVTVDSSGNLWITDNNNYRVDEFNSAGSFVQKFGSQGTGNGKFEAPNYIYVGTQ